MTGRLPGRNTIEAKLSRLLIGGNSLLLLTVAGGFVCSRWLGNGNEPEPPFSWSLVCSLLFVAAAGLTVLCRLLCLRIKWLISDPIDDLTRKMELVSRSKDYLVRVKSWSDDEIGALFDCFNDMLAEISIRDERLALHSEELEIEVAQRTRELSKVNRQLADSLEEVRRAMQAAQSASRAKSDFLAQMSHEIRTPICGVLGMTELLQESELSKKQSRYVERVRHSGEALLGIINDILDFSKIEAGRMELESIPFDLHELVAETVEMFGPDADKKGLELACRVAAEVPRSFMGDPGRLRQVMVNLIGNAVKFTGEGSVRLEVLMDCQPNLVRISVSDTGIGITPEARTRIFNKFVQADQSMTRKYGGTGLGLAIVRQLIALMGGALALTSVPGKGSTFSFTVRLQPLFEHEWLWPERCCSVLLRGKKVLLALDDAPLRVSLSSQLTGWGIEAAYAEDAAGALDRLLAAPFDLAVIGQRLAGADGIELAATIKTIPTGRALRMMLLADADFGEQHLRAKEMGVFVFFKKSLRQHGLYWALLRALGMTPASGEEGCYSDQPLGRSPKVLLVEDNPVNQEVGRELLQSLGCLVELVENGLLALQAVQSAPYDLVFMDCGMPVMDGLEATRSIRAWEESEQPETAGGPRRRLPIIALTAYAMKGDRMACLASGADDYLSKPFTRQELAGVIGRHLGSGEGVAPPTAATAGTVASATATLAATAEAALATSASATTADVISRDKMTGALEMIRQLPGNRGMEVLRKVIDLYLASTPTLLQTMREAESGGDAEKLKAAAHSFKSSSANLGALKLADVCLELETLGRAGSTQGALPLLIKVEEEYRLVRDALQGDTPC